MSTMQIATKFEYRKPLRTSAYSNLSNSFLKGIADFF